MQYFIAVLYRSYCIRATEELQQFWVYRYLMNQLIKYFQPNRWKYQRI